MQNTSEGINRKLEAKTYKLCFCLARLNTSMSIYLHLISNFNIIIISRAIGFIFCFCGMSGTDEITQ